jgi:DNA-directed DNA polymerase III PolC
MIVHLNAHSHYSLLEAEPSPQELVQTAAALGMPAIALTDHYSLAGVVEFQRACKKTGIDPIYGLEIDLEVLSKEVEYPGRLILLAQNEQGWANLCSINSTLNLHIPSAQPVTLDILEKFHKEVLAISDDQMDWTGRTLQQLQDIFPDSLYVALSNPDGRQNIKMQQLADLAERLQLPIIAVQPIFTLDAASAHLLKTLTAIRLGTTIDKVPTRELPPAESIFLSPEQMQLRYGKHPQALAATLEIANRCKFDLPLGKRNFPSIPLPENTTANQILREKADAGAIRRYGKISPDIRERLDFELGVIGQLQFEPVFLIVEEIISYAQQKGIPTSSRGSAASSLVAYCLGITNPDPIRHNLYFERFLNPARTSPPDIDTDICSRGREQVIRHVFETFGEDQTAMVGTINRFRPRSAMSDVAKAHGLTPEQAHELSRSLPHSFFYRIEDSDESEPSPFRELAAANKQPEYQRIFQDAESLLNLPRHFSIHAGGIVVGPGKLAGIIPLQRSGSHNTIITQMDMESVQAFGLIKIDLLGIRGLTVLGDVATAVHSWSKSEYSSPMQVLDNIPLEDSDTSDLIYSGHTIGCFQIESPGMRSTLREINARKVDDIMVALALYKPGPLRGGLRDNFVRRIKKLEPVEHLHPAVIPILDETQGIILYQEQVLRLVHELAGLSLADADLLRRAMTHFGTNFELNGIRQRFIRAVHEGRQIPLEICEQLWSLMAAFAGYGLPKAHAASYAITSWKSAWLKTHFPAEFMAAVLANWGGYYSQRVYINEVCRMGLILKPPHVNHSRQQFSVAYPSGEPVLYMGLDQVRDLTQRTQNKIFHERPFTSLEDFLVRVDPRQQEVENLICAGALEGFGSAPTMLKRITGGKWLTSQPGLFEIENAEESDWSKEQWMEAQEKVLGISLVAHPLELVAEKIAKAGAISTMEAAGEIGKKVTIAGIRQSSHRVKTTKGETMLFLTLEDMEGTMDVMILPDMYRRVKNLVYGRSPFFITGLIELDETRGESMMRAENLRIVR